METLTNEQLCAMARAGSAEAVEALVENNLPYVRRLAWGIISNPVRAEMFAAWGIEADDLIQGGTIGLWKAIDGYDPEKESRFLTYANRSIRNGMNDLIRQYSRDAVWRLRTDKAQPWRIVCLDEPLDDTGEDGADFVYELTAAPLEKLPEAECIEREALDELKEARAALTERESVYVQYRFGDSDSDGHSMAETAQHFHLTGSRAKAMEKDLLATLRNELLCEIPERAFVRAEDRLTRRLVAEGELHAVELRLKTEKKRGKNVISAVYEYLADCDGAWGELSCDFKKDTVDVLKLADWDTTVSRRFAMRAMDYFKTHHRRVPLDRLVLTFISPEQRRAILRRGRDSS